MRLSEHDAMKFIIYQTAISANRLAASTLAGLGERGGILQMQLNTLKNQGYNFEHNYSHGEQDLPVVFIMMMMMAFLVDQAQQLCCALLRAVWAQSWAANAGCGNA